MLSRKELKASKAEEQVAPGCCHHWVIQTATGPVSEGECQKCHEVRQFENFVERKDWGDRREVAQSEPEIPAEELADADF
ncbi:MAG: hypothetical protein ACE5Q6_03520 [Dehalococcoidia bacterium]